MLKIKKIDKNRLQLSKKKKRERSFWHVAHLSKKKRKKDKNNYFFISTQKRDKLGKQVFYNFCVFHFILFVFIFIHFRTTFLLFKFFIIVKEKKPHFVFSTSLHMSSYHHLPVLLFWVCQYIFLFSTFFLFSVQLLLYWKP